MIGAPPSIDRSLTEDRAGQPATRLSCSAYHWRTAGLPPRNSAAHRALRAASIPVTVAATSHRWLGSRKTDSWKDPLHGCTREEDLPWHVQHRSACRFLCHDSARLGDWARGCDAGRGSRSGLPRSGGELLVLRSPESLGQAVHDRRADHVGDTVARPSVVLLPASARSTPRRRSHSRSPQRPRPCDRAPCTKQGRGPAAACRDLGWDSPQRRSRRWTLGPGCRPRLKPDQSGGRDLDDVPFSRGRSRPATHRVTPGRRDTRRDGHGSRPGRGSPRVSRSLQP